MTCTEVRARLQDLHDEGRSPDRELASHLAGCTGCSAFAEFLSGIGEAAREALDETVAGLARPEYPKIFARAAQTSKKAAFASWRTRLAVAAAAAVLVAGLGIAAGARAWAGRRERLLVASSVDGFIDELFTEPLLAEAGTPSGDQVPGFRDWLENPDATLVP